jgi:hypothetical protein
VNRIVCVDLNCLAGHLTHSIFVPLNKEYIENLRVLCSFTYGVANIFICKHFYISFLLNLLTMIMMATDEDLPSVISREEWYTVCVLMM